MHMIHAMMCGCAIVTNKTYWTESIIVDGENGILVDDMDSFKPALKKIVGNKEKIAALSFKARETVIDRFDHSNFLCNWDKTLFRAAEQIYKR